MDPFIECVGDPRAMGHCQGLTHRAAIQQQIAATGGRTRRKRLPSLSALTSGAALGRGTGREVIRHYTHLAERMAGIARSADVPLASLMEIFCASTSDAAPDGELVTRAIALATRQSENEQGDPLVLRTLAGSSFARSQWILRRSRPEVGFVSAEITLPWLATAVAGINEAGVAVAIVPRSASHGGGVNAGAVNARRAPHAVLLVQECLQRFGDLDGCLDWCRKRPRSGNVSLIIADAAAHLAKVEVEGTECRVSDVDCTATLDGASAEADERLRTHLRDHGRVDLAALAAAGESAGELVAWLEPAQRSLSVRSIRGVGQVDEPIRISL